MLIFQKFSDSSRKGILLIFGESTKVAHGAQDALCHRRAIVSRILCRVCSIFAQLVFVFENDVL